MLSKLWQFGKSAPEVMQKLVAHVQIGIANEEDCQRALGIELDVNVAEGVLDPGPLSPPR